MVVQADAEAVLETARVFPQHQSALTLLNTRLQEPGVTECRWLDLGCGKGQIISQLDTNLTPFTRAKISYVGFDLNFDYTRTAGRVAHDLGFRSHSFHNGHLAQFDGIVPTGTFDFITCTNTVHELQPGAFAGLILRSILRLAPHGELYVYDMEFLLSPELGALPWSGVQAAGILNEIFLTLGITLDVQPSVWQHTNARGWSVVIRRDHVVSTNEQITARFADIVSRMEHAIDALLVSRLTESNTVLKTYYEYGMSTASERASMLRALYEFWAVSHAMELRR